MNGHHTQTNAINFANLLCVLTTASANTEYIKVTVPIKPISSLIIKNIKLLLYTHLIGFKHRYILLFRITMPVSYLLLLLTTIV